MDLWRECKEFLQKKQGGNIPFLFYIHYQNHAEIEYIFKSHKFEYPFCFDDKDELNKINKLPKDDRFRTFLLDKNNHVIAIGNPTTNLKIRNLYAKLVSKNEEAIADSPSCIFSPTQLNCGELRLGKTYQYRINIQNILEKTVKIDTIIPSCECMDISHTPDSIKPSGSSYFIVTYHADIAGDLFKTAHIYIKGEESPYMITWEGTVQ
ncbi:MAG: DUF1573 domain-containing protein [Parabacteroides sp.]|nr:DUF1573 domain-containing protein [Parabacteroides sp.]